MDGKFEFKCDCGAKHVFTIKHSEIVKGAPTEDVSKPSQEDGKEAKRKAGFEGFKKGFIEKIHEKAKKFNNEVRVSEKEMKWIRQWVEEFEGIEFKLWGEE